MPGLRYSVMFQLMRPARTNRGLGCDGGTAGLDKGGGSPGTTHAIYGADIGGLAENSKLGATTGKNGSPERPGVASHLGGMGDVKWPATTPLIQFRRIRCQHAEPTKSGKT
jgi:hypothetical protein